MEKQTVLEDFHMILGGYLYKNTFPIIFFSKFEEKKYFMHGRKIFSMVSEFVAEQ